MAEEENTDPVKKFVKKGRVEEWQRFMDEAISLDPGEKRDYTLSILQGVGKMLMALGQDTAPNEVIKLVAKDTTLMQIGVMVMNTVVFSDRGEEFRCWWNEWHDRQHPTAIFNGAKINVKGRPLILVGTFDPELPVTKRLDYMDIVNSAIKGANA